MSKKIYETDAQTMADLTAGKETVWKNPRYVPFDLVRGLCDLVVSEADIADAEARLARFAPFLERAFPETQANHGLIESPLAELEKMQPALEKAYGGKIPGRLLLKKDSHLDIAGSVKARGGIYEVLKHAEDLALAAGKLTEQDDYAAFADEDMQKFLGGYTVQVGSTGNLGLSIGIMSAALGFRVIVHMSADAKQWKKDLLRSKGVEVIEYADDYSRAVEEGRKRSEADPTSYFVDDEKSVTLFLGYAVAAKRLDAQLKEKGIAYKKGCFPTAANGRSLIQRCETGVVKVLAGEKYGEILGVHIYAPHATELIGEAVMAMKLEATLDELIGTIHAHPTVCECIHEAALAAENRAIHIANRRK